MHLSTPSQRASKMEDGGSWEAICSVAEMKGFVQPPARHASLHVSSSWGVTQTYALPSKSLDRVCVRLVGNWLILPPTHRRNAAVVQVDGFRTRGSSLGEARMEGFGKHLHCSLSRKGTKPQTKAVASLEVSGENCSIVPRVTGTLPRRAFCSGTCCRNHRTAALLPILEFSCELPL
jgi:hypothetical protein